MDFSKICLSTISLIAKGYFKTSEYPWINTKFDMFTGEDFPREDPIKGCDTVYCWQITKQQRFIDVLEDCFTAFLKNYVVCDRSYFQYQTLNKDAVPVEVIPAVPDIDPCYHTGLSLIDSFEILQLA